MQDVKKQEKQAPPLICCFSRLEIKDACVAYGTSTRQNNPVYHGPFYNLYVALAYILHTYKDKSNEEKSVKIGQLMSNFPNVVKGNAINARELRVEEFVNADGVNKAQILTQITEKFPWLKKTNITKEAFLENKKKTQEKPKPEDVILHGYSIPEELTSQKDNSPKECFYVARKESAITVSGALAKCYHVIEKGTTYSIHYSGEKTGKDNTAVLHIFPNSNLEKLKIKGKVEIIGRKPLHKLEEEEKKKQKEPDFKMDKPKSLPMACIVSKPFGTEEKDPAKKKKRTKEHTDFLKSIINFIENE